jgi:hypothetical protein
LLTEGSAPSKKRGPEAGLADSEIMCKSMDLA